MKKGQFVLVIKDNGWRNKTAIVGRMVSYDSQRKNLMLEWPLLGMFPDDCVRAPKNIKNAIAFKSVTPKQIQLYATKRGALAGLKKVASLDDGVLSRAMMAHMRAGRDWFRDFGDRPVVDCGSNKPVERLRREGEY